MVPRVDIPHSASTVSVHVIDSGARLDIPAEQFLMPQINGYTRLACPAFSFLISHPSGQKLLFDLSIRRDWEKLSPKVLESVQKPAHDWHLSVPQNVSDVLAGNEVGLNEVNAIIWSHPHFDHLGNPSLFPKSTNLVVGPGFKKVFGDGFPSQKDAPVLGSDWEGRTLKELDFEKDPGGLSIGMFKAMDWFGDGSFYILDTPGHAVGHLCGLARVQSDSFVLMAADCAHHPGEFRPSKHIHLPYEIPPSSLPHHWSAGERNIPFYRPGKKFTLNYEECLQTLSGIEVLDADKNIFVILAHDHPVLSVLQEKDTQGKSWLFPEKSLNNWKAGNLKNLTQWRFLQDFGVET